MTPATRPDTALSSSTRSDGCSATLRRPRASPPASEVVPGSLAAHARGDVCAEVRSLRPPCLRGGKPSEARPGGATRALLRRGEDPTPTLPKDGEGEERRGDHVPRNDAYKELVTQY